MAPRQRISSLPVQDTSDRLHLSKPLEPCRTSSGSVNETSLNCGNHLMGNATEFSQQCHAVPVRERHDFFNLFTLLIVIAATLMNWDLTKLTPGKNPDDAWTGEYFFLNWTVRVYNYTSQKEGKKRHVHLRQLYY
jgi:hypothetical protein